MVTSCRGWLLLTDFSPFKPFSLPADNPADFSFFYDTSGQRRCYLAPERFHEGPSPPPAPDPTSAQSAVCFSAGCVVAGLFLDGAPLFDLGSLLAFRRGTFATRRSSVPTCLTTRLRTSSFPGGCGSLWRRSAQVRDQAVSALVS